MNSAIFVVLVLLWGSESRPVRQEVLAGEDFLAFLMSSHRPRGQQIVNSSPQHIRDPQQIVHSSHRLVHTPQHLVHSPQQLVHSPQQLVHSPQQLVHSPAVTTEGPVTVTATTTETGPTETETSATTLVETEPPSIVSVRVSSSVRKEAYHENNVLPASATRSHFGVEAAGYREKLEDSVAEATQEFHDQREPKEDEKKPYAEALTFEESGLGYESRVSSETSQSRVYFSRPEPVRETVVVQTSRSKQQYKPQTGIAAQNGEDQKYVTRYQKSEQKPQQRGDQQYSSQSIASQIRDERHYDPHNAVSQHREQFSSQPISQLNQEDKFESQKILTTQPAEQQRNFGQQRTVEKQSDYRLQQQVTVQQQYTTQEPETASQTQGHYQTRRENSHSRNYELDNRPQEEPQGRQERNYEQPEENYEVDESISVMSNGRAHGVQTERPQDNKFGQVQEGRNYRKYRVEEKTPDGFIVGEYGVVSHDDGGVRGVRYTADGSINPRLIYEALVKFLSLK